MMCSYMKLGRHLRFTLVFERFSPAGAELGTASILSGAELVVEGTIGRAPLLKRFQLLQIEWVRASVRFHLLEIMI